MNSYLKSFILFFVRSPKAKILFKKCQNTFNKDAKFKALIISVKTRFNSVFLMYQRFLELKDPLISYCQMDKKVVGLDEHEWELLEQLVDILEPFYDATVEMSSGMYCLKDSKTHLTPDLSADFPNSNSYGSVSTARSHLVIAFFFLLPLWFAEL